jgi:hypothetical protein
MTDPSPHGGRPRPWDGVPAGERRLRDLFLRPDYEPNRPRPDYKSISSYSQRRRAKVAYQREAGMFQTWVYAVVLALLVIAVALVVLLG